VRKWRWIVSSTGYATDTYTVREASGIQEALDRYLEAHPACLKTGGFVGVVDADTGRESRFRIRPPKKGTT
jgi:hypothetical protein